MAENEILQAEVKKLSDKNGKIIFPETRAKAVYTNDGKRLDSLIDNGVYIGDSIPTNIEPFDAQTLGGKYPEYYKNVAGLYDATCTYSNNEYYLTFVDKDILDIGHNIYTLRFVAPNDYQENSSFLVEIPTGIKVEDGSEEEGVEEDVESAEEELSSMARTKLEYGYDIMEYTPKDPAFTQGQVVLLNFDSTTAKCYFSAGSGTGGAGIASDLIIEPEISGLSNNVQGALTELNQKLNTLISDYNNLGTQIGEVTNNISQIVSGGTTVKNAENADTIGGKDINYLLDFNNLKNVPEFKGGGVTVSTTAPDVSETDILWIDINSTPGVAKYSNGTSWLTVGATWG